MALCLGDAEYGYYATRDPFGVEGDFITGPEVSQMFGEIIGAWLIHTWRLCGAPSPIRLVELGPGRGTLMADILRVSGTAPQFREAVTLHLVETSPALRARQAERLAAHPLRWHERFAEVPSGPLLLVANEFFDALPIRQFIGISGAWCERVVGLDGTGRLSFGLGAGRLQSRTEVTEGAVLEICPAGEAILNEVATRIASEGGAALILDYGYSGPAFGDTLQAIRRHAYADVLAAPGEADLTAHVDFGALARAATAAGAAAHGPIAQRDFLLGLGLLERAGRLGIDAAPATRADLQAAVERLAGPAAMGTLFKVLAVTRRGLGVPPFPMPI